MFINRLNQLCKPRRLLYYTEITPEELEAFRKGGCCEKVERYKGAFGTYDGPGIFYVRGMDRAVAGIEYRPEDERIDYPEELKSVVLEEAFFYSVEIDNDIGLTEDAIRTIFEKIAEDDDAHRACSDLSICANPSLIAIFAGSMGKRLRILYEWKVDRDGAEVVMKDDVERMDKDKLYHMAYFDPITGHHNWNHLAPYLEMPMDSGIRDYAFAHFDIKAFRVINEVYGHIAANKVLSNVVKAMNEADFVYASGRCHNDNFAMMIKDMPREEMIAKLEDFFEKLSHLEDDPNYTIYYRCGVVPMPRSLLLGNRVADAGKMAQALGSNHNRTDIVVYTDETNDEILWSNYIKAYVDTAIEQDEFMVFLQPKFDIHKEQIKGAEALIRWNFKKEQLLSPGRFIPFFEKDGTIGKIDEMVLRKVCAAFARWKEEGKPLYPVSVNLSRDQLYDRDLVEHLLAIVDEYGVDHGLIDFELTESATYDDMDHMISVLRQLREKGFLISMDDFGTGYSSLSLLTEMPLDTLKIDKSFVDGVGTEGEREQDIIVIRHIIALARELHFTCLAEGAEEKCQVERLRGLGCEIIQGYYYSKPIPIEEYEEKYL